MAARPDVLKKKGNGKGVPAKKPEAAPAGPEEVRAAFRERLQKTFMATDGVLDPLIYEMVRKVAQQEGIPVTGITVLGGRPYINATGLDAKLEALCREKGLVKKELRVEEIERPTQSNRWRAGFRGVLVLFDRQGFLEALKSVGQADRETIESLKEAFTYRFEDEGWAGAESIKMSTLKNLDCVIMMASRRATNRAKRAAVGCGLTSIDEVVVEAEVLKMVSPEGEEVLVAVPKGEAAEEAPEKTEAKAGEKVSGPSGKPEEKPEPATEKQLAAIYVAAEKAGFSPEEMKARMREMFGKESSKELTKEEASRLIDWLREREREREAQAAGSGGLFGGNQP